MRASKVKECPEWSFNLGATKKTGKTVEEIRGGDRGYMRNDRNRTSTASLSLSGSLFV